jgi:hypothetical protein
VPVESHLAAVRIKGDGRQTVLERERCPAPGRRGSSLLGGAIAADVGHQQRDQFIGVDGLDQMVCETSVRGALSIVLLSPTSHGHEQ